MAFTLTASEGTRESADPELPLPLEPDPELPEPDPEPLEPDPDPLPPEPDPEVPDPELPDPVPPLPPEPAPPSDPELPEPPLACAVLELTMIEPHPATSDAAIRRESKPAVHRRIVMVKPWQVDFERVLSGLQTLPRRNATIKPRHSPAKVSPRSAFLRNGCPEYN